MHQLTIVPRISPEAQSLERYLKELNSIPLIDAEEELRLAQQIRAGDRVAVEALVRANLRFVVSVAKQYQNPDLSLMDLISEGNIGLMMAAERFDATKGFKFISYAVWWIRKLIMEAIREKSRLVRLPMAKWKQLKQLQRVMDGLEQELERRATTEEVAEATGMTVAAVEELLTIKERRLSMHAPLELQGDIRERRSETTLSEILPDREASAPDSDLLRGEYLKEEMDDLLACLSAREARILRLYFGLEPKLKTSVSGLQIEQLGHSVSGRVLSLEDIGEEVGLCKERVRVLKNRALLKLRLRS